VKTGPATMFGAAASALSQAQARTPFERDLREFGLVVARLTLALVIVVLSVRILFGRPALDSLLFAVALAVGLTPELLPMITTVTLSRGALRMARRKVIVKRLVSIHDLGAMSVLCTDKTGTLTSAKITLACSLGPTALTIFAPPGSEQSQLRSAAIAVRSTPRSSPAAGRPRTAGRSRAGRRSIFSPARIGAGHGR
jgi:Mg2+-importing ATPase